MSISQLSIIQTMRVFIVLCLLVPLGNFKDESPKSIYDLLPGGKNSPLSVQNGEASQLTVPMLEELPSDQPAIFSKLVRELSVSPSILENRGELTDLLKSSVKSIMKEDPVLPTINPDVHSSEELQNAKENLPPEVAKDPSVGAMVSLMMTTGKKAAKKVASKKKVKKATQYAIHDAIDAHIKKALAHKVKEEQTKIPKQTNDINKVKESMKRVCQEAKSAGKEAKKDPKILKSGEDEIRKMAGDAIDRASSDSVDVMLTDAGFVKMTLFDLLKPVEDAKTDKEPANVSKILRELGEANEQTNNLMVENTGNTNDEFLV